MVDDSSVNFGECIRGRVMGAEMEVFTDHGDSEVVGEVGVEVIGVTDAVGEHLFDLENTGIGSHDDDNDDDKKEKSNNDDA